MACKTKSKTQSPKKKTAKKCVRFIEKHAYDDQYGKIYRVHSIRTSDGKKTAVFEEYMLPNRILHKNVKIECDTKEAVEWVKLKNGSIIFADDKKRDVSEKLLSKATPKSKVQMAKKLLAEGKLKTGHVTRLGIKRQTPPAPKSKAVDRKRSAMLPGYRVSENGNLYYEARENRSDTPLERMDKAYVHIQRQKLRKRYSASKKLKDQFKPKFSIQSVSVIPRPSKGGITYLDESKIKRGKVLTDKQQMDVLKREAAKYNKGKIEYGFVVDKYGNILYLSRGDERSCPNASYFWWELHRDDRLIHCHNHPGFTPSNNWHGVASTFSRADLTNTGRLERRDVCVVGYSGVIHRLRIKNENVKSVPASTLTKIYTTVRDYATEKCFNNPEYQKLCSKIYERSSAGASKEELKKLEDLAEKTKLQALVDAEVEKYIELCNKYKKGAVLEWIEDKI